MDSLLDIEDAFSRQALSAPWGELGRSATLGIVALYSKFVVSVLNSYSAQGVDTFRQHVMHRDAAQGLITVCNHTSTMDDPMLICSLLPASFFFREHQHHGNRWSLCAAEICYSNVLLGQFFQSGKTLPIQRGGGIDQPIMRTVAAEIARGHWVHVFPEGKVTYTGTLGPLRWGIGKLVCDARRRANGRDPVVLPFYHSGMGRVLPKHAILPRTGSDIAVVVGEPLDLSDLTCRCNATGDDLRAVWRDITKRVGSALYELEARVPPNAVQAQGGTQQQDQERSRELDSALPGVPTERQ